MSKMSVNDAAEHFGISKEAIHNRIRRGSLEVVMKDGIKMVIIDTEKSMKSPKRTASVKSTVSSDRYYKLLEEQNARLQSRVEVLETETRSLRDQKELMLIQERKKIELIYKEKDEQLKNILSTISSQFMLSTPSPEIEVETLEAEIEIQEEEGKLISLKKYLKRMKISSKKAKKIKSKFKKKANIDERIILIDDKFYVNTVKYDYSGLL